MEIKEREAIKFFTQFSKYLDETEAREPGKLSHQWAQISPEPWLIHEATWCVNNDSDRSWEAIGELKRVDLTLTEKNNSGEIVRIEFKIIDRNYWGPSMKGILEDLQGKGKKPAADYALGFLFKEKQPPRESQSHRNTLRLFDINVLGDNPKVFYLDPQSKNQGFQATIVRTSKVWPIEWRHEDGENRFYRHKSEKPGWFGEMKMVLFKK